MSHVVVMSSPFSGPGWLVLTQRQVIDSYGQVCDVLEQAYVRLFHLSGAQIQTVPNITTVDLQRYFSLPGFRGVVLTGGNNIHPSTYGEPDRLCDDCSLDRDRIERQILDLAVRRHVPVFGICRGMQFLNVYFGGAVVVDVSSRFNHPLGRPHEINLNEVSAQELGVSSKWTVNSFHDQAVTQETLARSLQSFAWAEGAPIVEGLYHPALPIAGVQFHPERCMPSPNLGRILVHAFMAKQGFWKPTVDETKQ